MPTYDYRCDACEHTFELFQGMRDSVKRTCPKCKARKLKRLIGTGAAILIGGRSSAPEPSSHITNESQSDTSSSESSTADTKTTGDDKKMSGSTSTPTHEAREHRGIGNLVDAAKRTRAASEKAKNKPERSAPSSSKKSEKKSAKKASKSSKPSSKKSTKSTRSRSPRTGK